MCVAPSLRVGPRSFGRSVVWSFQSSIPPPFLPPDFLPPEADMRSLLALSLSKKFLLLFLTALLIFSALISTAAIARRGGRPLSFTHSPPSADRDKSPPPPQGQTEEYKYFQEAGTDAELSRMSHHRTATTWFFPFLLSPSLPAPRAYVRACVRCACRIQHLVLLARFEIALD
ncbi:hypothetical protein L209DRAFT_446028 [Thermothelomyces heterothallicus CBS 203.75]